MKIIVAVSVVLICAVLIGASATIGVNAQESILRPRVDVVKIDGYIINPVTAKFISGAIATAAQKEAACLIIELDTPGGLLESTRMVVKEILNAPIPIVTYISPSGSRAGSAGVFITYASHIAAMAPSTNIGAAHPIGVGFTPSFEKKDSHKTAESPDVMSEKVLNDLLAWAESIAKTRKRNVQWVKSAVVESASIGETEAVKNNVVDVIAVDINDLLKKIDGKTVETKYGPRTINTGDAQITTVALSNRERVLYAISHPNIAYILMLLGMIGLVFEFSHPGIGFSGIAGLICILLAFYSFQVLPINYAGLSLIILAVVLFVAEAFTPTFGLLTLGGIVAFVFGSLMLIQSPYPFLKISLHIIIPTAIAMAVITFFLLTLAIKAHRRKIMTGKEGLIDETATAIAAFDKNGKVFCHGEIWSAQNIQNQRIPKGAEVKIVKVEGLKLLVEKKGA